MTIDQSSTCGQPAIAKLNTIGRPGGAAILRMPVVDLSWVTNLEIMVITKANLEALPLFVNLKTLTVHDGYDGFMTRFRLSEFLVGCPQLKTLGIALPTPCSSVGGDSAHWAVLCWQD